MSEQVKSRWSAILQSLSEQIPPDSFNTWLKDSEIVSSDDHHIEIGVANLFAKKWIEQRYTALIVETISSLLGETFQIRFSISPALYQAQRKRSPRASSPQPQVRSATKKQSLPVLNTSYRFEHFVSGPCNRLGLAAATSICANPGEYNPLLFYGGNGTGKTHLIQAICHSFGQKRPEDTICYMSAEQFVTDYTKAVSTRSLESFRRRIRSYSLLAIDDIQLLAQGNKSATQQEFHHAFDSLVNSGRQIVLATDSPVESIDGFSDKLRSRMISGLSVELSLPDRETRIALIRRKAAYREVVINPTVAEAMADRIKGDVRAIEGAVGRIAAAAHLAGEEISLGNVNGILGAGRRQAVKRKPDMRTIAEAVADEFGVSLHDLQGRKRTKLIRTARQVALTLSRRIASASLNELGIFYGGRSHATVLNTIRNISPALFEDPLQSRPVQRILTVLGTDVSPREILHPQSELPFQQPD